MEERERAIRRWFDMWLRAEDMGILGLFAPDCTYIESWGPEYHGAAAVKHWFDEWNTRGRVLVWDILQFFHKEEQSIVEWHFKDSMNDGTSEAFDGLSLIRWTAGGQILFLREFGCNTDTYDPYEKSGRPQFRDAAHPWFHASSDN